MTLRIDAHQRYWQPRRSPRFPAATQAGFIA
ncbi:hypothetical protein C7413_121137 [Paraburkholderia silvatlantica]|nr:hypothetical protein C7411_122137 [Paraburkholderia silvatlantica]PXW33150.1 hypothetical protein C7413_121137 [Paraburkholderia silvatlantica]